MAGIEPHIGPHEKGTAASAHSFFSYRNGVTHFCEFGGLYIQANASVAAPFHAFHILGCCRLCGLCRIAGEEARIQESPVLSSSAYIVFIDCGGPGMREAASGYLLLAPSCRVEGIRPDRSGQQPPGWSDMGNYSGIRRNNKVRTSVCLFLVGRRISRQTYGFGLSWRKPGAGHSGFQEAVAWAPLQRQLVYFVRLGSDRIRLPRLSFFHCHPVTFSAKHG